MSNNSSIIYLLISQPEAETVLGQEVTSINPGMHTEEVSGNTLYFCSMRAPVSRL